MQLAFGLASQRHRPAGRVVKAGIEQRSIVRDPARATSATVEVGTVVIVMVIGLALLPPGPIVLADHHKPHASRIHVGAGEQHEGVHDEPKRTTVRRPSEKPAPTSVSMDSASEGLADAVGVAVVVSFA